MADPDVDMLLRLFAGCLELLFGSSDHPVAEKKEALCPAQFEGFTIDYSDSIRYECPDCGGVRYRTKEDGHRCYCPGCGILMDLTCEVRTRALDLLESETLFTKEEIAGLLVVVLIPSGKPQHS